MKNKSIVGRLTSGMVYIVGALLLGVSIFFWINKYPAHIAFQEQAQMFLWTGEYLWQTVAQPGGVAYYLGEFVTQFFYEIWWGVAIVSILLTTIYVLSYLVLCKSVEGKRPLLSVLSFVPVIFAWLFLMDMNSLVAMPVALLLTLAATVACLRLRHSLANRQYMYLSVVLAVSVVLYALLGAMSFVMVAYIMVYEIWHSRNYYAVLLSSTLLVPVVFYIFVPSPLSRLYTTNCYYRLYDITPRMSYDAEEEDALLYSFLIRYGKWSAIIKHAEKRVPLDMASRQALLCALSEKGELLDRMFDFPILSPKDLLSEQYQNMVEPTVVSDIFFHLGFLNLAEQYAHNAQLIQQKYSVRSYQRWAECAILKGDTRVAKKFLDALKQTLFYADWAKEREAMVGNAEAIDADNTYGPIYRRQMHEAYFMANEDLDFILERSLGPTRSFSVNYDYLMAYLILNNDLDRLAELHTDYQQRPHKIVQEALVLHWMQNHPSFAGMPWNLSRDVVKSAVDFQNALNNGGNMQTMFAQYGNTYWFYYTFSSRLIQ